MNHPEAVVWMTAIILTTGYLSFVFRDWKLSVVLAALTAVPLFVSVNHTSQFLTADETYIIDDINWALMRQWDSGALRTTHLFISTFARLLHKFTPQLSDASLYLILKSAHWFVKLLPILATHFVLDREFINRKNRSV